MLTHVRNLWRPEVFHLHHQLDSKAPRFEGWYFKVVDARGRSPLAIIPGVFLGEDPHAFIQVLDGAQGKAWYHRFALDTFQASRRRFDVQIGSNRFHAGGLRLNLSEKNAADAPRIWGELNFGKLTGWPVRPWSPGVMGPLGFLPFLQCYHGILSVDHTLHGALDVDGVTHSFDAGRGYLEKDWGRSFPEGYIWMQSNHFAQPGVGVVASIAQVPLLGTALRGFLACFLHEGRLHRFTTYGGARIARCVVNSTHVQLRIEDARHVLEIEAEQAQGAILKAPYGRHMLERVAETMGSKLHVRFSRRKRGLMYEGTGHHGALEAQGKLAPLTQDGPSRLRSLLPALNLAPTQQGRVDAFRCLAREE